jgi:hypothetical protein
MAPKIRNTTTVDLSKSLQDIDGEDWGEVTGPTDLVVTCHRLRRKPLRDLDDHELRIGIGQAIGLSYLVPVALARLEADPMIQATFFPGDLLKNVLKAPAQFWDQNRDLWPKADAIATRFFEVAEMSLEAQRDILDDDRCVGPDLLAEIRAIYSAFSQNRRG